jgi:hypothetical protein
MAYIWNNDFRLINEQLKNNAMNKLLKFTAITVFAFAGMFSSCDDMMDVHREYIEGGEIIYAPKVDSLVFRNGKRRAQLWFWLLESLNVRSVDIFWNSYADSLIVPVTPSAGLDSVMVYVPLKDERSYTFYVRTTDIFGNHSLIEMASATSYDSIYASALMNRGVKKIVQTEFDVQIQWYGITDDYIYSEVRYTGVDGEEQIARVLPNETSSLASGIKQGSTVEHRSLFVPPNSIDTFYLDWVDVSGEIQESTPFNGPHIFSAAAPCEIQARDFDFGGEGLAFHDVSNRTPNSSYRTAAGDELSKTVDIEGGGNLGYVGVGEWLVYTVDVQDAGVYAADAYLSVNNGVGGSFYFSVDGNSSETATAPNQSSWSNWIYVFETYPNLTQPAFWLSAGKHKIRFTVAGGGFNLMGYKFTRISG